MHLAILMTNTDESAFAQRHPKDGEKFTALIHRAAPDWTTDVFAVKDGIFPDTMEGFDGAVITGSPASVHDPAPWVGTLCDLIRQMVSHRTPIFGACFGHQAIALALGGNVKRNPHGWVHGLTKNDVVHRTPWMQALPAPLHLYGSHMEQVTELPDGAMILTKSQYCPVTGFAIGAHVYTTQHHPEMSHDFIAALTDELSDELGTEQAAKAHASLAQPADTESFALSVAQFFEQAPRHVTNPPRAMTNI